MMAGPAGDDEGRVLSSHPSRQPAGCASSNRCHRCHRVTSYSLYTSKTPNDEVNHLRGHPPDHCHHIRIPLNSIITTASNHQRETTSRVAFSK
eukprot:scaffold111178_cov50-Cyclotella_meneghiniana.AAC.3